MVRLGRFSGRCGALWVAALLSAGCGEEAPPYDALPLRDALRAAPEVMASLPKETRRDVALRLEESALAPVPVDEKLVIPPPEVTTLDALASAADEAREEKGEDALVLGAIEQEGAEMFLAPREAKEPGDTSEGPPKMRGRPGDTTAALEEAALRGRAGRWVKELAARSEAQEIVRTTGLPMGAWAFEDKLYVNASWLVALEALEEEGAESGPSPAVVPIVGFPGSKPLSVDFNPYMLPDSVEQCALQVQTTCGCAASSSCDHAVTDPTFADANAECTWVNQGASNAAALCVLALMNIDGVRACVESGGSACAALPVVTRDDALAFLASTDCMSLLEQCLADGTLSQGSSGGSSGSSSSCGGCSGSSCDGCNEDCSKCNDNCSKCNENCSDCNQNCKDCNQNCKGSNCAVARRPGQSPVPSPVGTAFWLSLPIAYLYLLSRRRRP
ncbi:DUF4215 domain-containing protein [Polyangium spumosum]|uniref:Uncharacterized protein n=1 Tax=Polyangium spumosum TaxID=889282 RepID=A0A6N7PWW0_9BACT|nr:DUF4215 domain-containing protein [Polyangium spumosum]MRG96483.1 hypothetical protein [Polyangium spumosum]